MRIILNVVVLHESADRVVGVICAGENIEASIISQMIIQEMPRIRIIINTVITQHYA